MIDTSVSMELVSPIVSCGRCIHDPVPDAGPPPKPNRKDPICFSPYRYRAPHAFTSSQGAGIRTSRSSSLVKITGIASLRLEPRSGLMAIQAEKLP
jgi:hypothetical protein